MTDGPHACLKSICHVLKYHLSEPEMRSHGRRFLSFFDARLPK